MALVLLRPLTKWLNDSKPDIRRQLPSDEFRRARSRTESPRTWESPIRPFIAGEIWLLDEPVNKLPSLNGGNYDA